MKFSVVTPCKNAGHLLRPTVEAVLNQRAVTTGRAELEYLVVDGGSSDGSLGSIEDLLDDRVTVTSEIDAGMYDALAKGLDRASGDVHSYLNAGDLYNPSAFDIVADILELRPSANWITGMIVIHNGRGDIVASQTPFRYRRHLLRSGAYGPVLPWLQQESTFWTRTLTSRVDLGRLREFRVAGDSFLWWTFAEDAEPNIVSAHLGGFRRHGNHLSADTAGYLRELHTFADQPAWAKRQQLVFDKIAWRMPVALKKRLNPHHLLVWTDLGWS